MAPRRRWKQTDQSWLCLQVKAWDKAVTRGPRTHSYRKILLCALCAFSSLQTFEPHSVHVPQGLNHHKPALYSLAQGLQIARTVPGRSPMGSVFYTQLWVVLNHPLKLPCSWVPLVFGQLLALDKTGQRKKLKTAGDSCWTETICSPFYTLCVENTKGMTWNTKICIGNGSAQIGNLEPCSDLTSKGNFSI